MKLKIFSFSGWIIVALVMLSFFTTSLVQAKPTTPNRPNVTSCPTFGETELIWSAHNYPVTAGQFAFLTNVEVSCASKIRIYVGESSDSPTRATLRIVDHQISDPPIMPDALTLDTLSLSPHSQLTKVYDAPGKELNFIVDAAGPASRGLDRINILIYGN